jgi:hypothetical protein
MNASDLCDRVLSNPSFSQTLFYAMLKLLSNPCLYIKTDEVA